MKYKPTKDVYCAREIELTEKVNVKNSTISQA